MKYGLGLDLGQVNDPAAIVITEKVPQAYVASLSVTGVQSKYDGDILNVRHIERMKLRTSYPDIVRHICMIMDRASLKGNCDLVVDHTGVGRAPVDMMREAGLTPIAVSITSGGAEQRHVQQSENLLQMDRNVPKKELVALLRRLFESRPQRLRIAQGLKFADALIKELSTFSQKISKKGRASFEALRASDHDDLVLALGLIAWWAVKSPIGPLQITKPAQLTEEWYKLEADKLAAARARNIRLELRRKRDPDFQEDD